MILVNKKSTPWSAFLSALFFIGDFSPTSYNCTTLVAAYETYDVLRRLTQNRS